MGQLLGMFWYKFASKQEVRVLMIGLDEAGKTTTLYQLKLGAVVTSIPTIGINVETLEYKRLRLTVCDIGGQQRVRAMWRYYLNNPAGIIFVVDAADHKRFPEACNELHSLLQLDELLNIVVMVFANKQDLPQAVSPPDLAIHLRLHELRQRWKIFGVSASKGEGLAKGLEQLYGMIRQRSL